MSDNRERVEALKSRVAAFHGTHNQDSHGKRGAVGKLRQRVRKAVTKAGDKLYGELPADYYDEDGALKRIRDVKPPKRDAKS